MTPTGGDNYLLASNLDSSCYSDGQLAAEFADGDPTPVNSPGQGDNDWEICNQVNERITEIP